MQAIILAAGQGTRLRPFTYTSPKCLVPVLGKELLSLHLKVLNMAEVSPVTLVGGYMADRLTDKPASLILNPDFTTTNMVWTLRHAFNIFSYGAIVAYGDIVYPPSALQALLGHPGDICIVVDKDWEAYWRARFSSPLDDAETLRVGPDGLLVEIGNQPKSFEDVQGQYIGLMKFTAKGAGLVREVVEKAVTGNEEINGKSVELAYMTDLLQHLINLGHQLQPVWIDGGWAEIDNLADIPVAEERISLWAQSFI